MKNTKLNGNHKTFQARILIKTDYSEAKYIKKKKTRYKIVHRKHDLKTYHIYVSHHAKNKTPHSLYNFF